MSWLNKLLPPKIKRSEPGVARKSALPEGLWSKCPSCEAVLYATDLENNLNVCPKCGHHNRLKARERLDLLLDAEGRFEIGAEVLPVDTLKDFEAIYRLGKVPVEVDEQLYTALQ